MKLPTENNGKDEQQPVGDSAGSGPSVESGASGQQASSGGGSGSANNDSSSGNAQASSNQSGPPQEDFSEYLWMENEEEFDTQVDTV